MRTMRPRRRPASTLKYPTYLHALIYLYSLNVIIVSHHEHANEFKRVKRAWSSWKVGWPRSKASWTRWTKSSSRRPRLVFRFCFCWFDINEWFLRCAVRQQKKRGDAQKHSDTKQPSKCDTNITNNIGLLDFCLIFVSLWEKMEKEAGERQRECAKHQADELARILTLTHELEYGFLLHFGK